MDCDGQVTEVRASVSPSDMTAAVEMYLRGRRPDEQGTQSLWVSRREEDLGPWEGSCVNSVPLAPAPAASPGEARGVVLLPCFHGASGNLRTFL